MTYYQLNAYKHPPNTHFANVKYLYHKQTFKNWCSPVIKVMVIKVIKNFRLFKMSDPKYGLQLMSDDYILENLIEELRETQ